jgi:hypothetical protein
MGQAALSLLAQDETDKGERVSNIYKFFEWTGAQDGYGAYGFDRWERLHTGPGEYNWSIIDAWLDKQGDKPKAFAIATHLSELDGWESFADCTPAWVYDGMNRPTMHGRPVGKIVTYTDKETGKVTSAALPYYNDQGRWWRYLKEFVMAMGARYDGDPRLSAVFAGPGLDIENQPSKAPFGDGNQSYRFGQLCDAYSDWHKEAFTKTPVFIVVSIGQGRMALAQHAAANGQGLKHNGGFVHDLDSHQGYDNFVGSWDAMQWANENGVPTWVESAYGYQDKRKYWWSIYATLAYHPVAVDVHSGLLDTFTAEQVAFIESHTNVTAATAPDAWCVLRDMEYPMVKWTQKQPDGTYLPYGCSGHPGNWDYYMSMGPDSDTDVVEDVGPSDAPESRQCRRITSATFEIELAAEGPYDLAIRWLDEPGHWLSVDGGATMLAGTGSGQWDTLDVTVEDRRFTLTGDGAAVHRVLAVPVDGGGEPEPPVDPVDWDAMLAQVNEAAYALERCYAEMSEAVERLNVAEMRRREASEAMIVLRGMIEAESE